MFSQIKLALFFIMILGAGGGLWYVQHLKSENEILKLNNEKLESADPVLGAIIRGLANRIGDANALAEKHWQELSLYKSLK